jgi:hypothetical protein
MALKLDKSKLVRNLAAKTKLIPHLDKFIKEHGDFAWHYDYSPKEGDDGWHPSGDCTPSLNELYWKAKEPTKEDFGASLIKTFQVGHFWHQYLQECVLYLGFAGGGDIERRGIQGWGELVNRETPPHLNAPRDFFQPFHYATGSGDVAPCQVPGHGEYVVDFKTMGTHDFKRNGMPDWCKDKYEAQINIYMDFFELDKALIVCILKDTPHDMKEFSFTRNQPLIDAIYQKWDLVSHCLVEGIEPPQDEVIELPFRGPSD